MSAANIAASMVLSACGASNDKGNEEQNGNAAIDADKGANADGPVTIRLALNKGEVSDDEVKEFETNNPDIKIEIEEMDPQSVRIRATASAHWKGSSSSRRHRLSMRERRWRHRE
ncbi:ABC-type glycerol-3-phosphate transport system substrate-binding protein [Paenibacillus harenae]|uniref:ABC-type glycerol-3-phosphate transport system substrate-binding protein n=1 Tax=Paenibacillus harenae TaxID=306543 RepID=A0ABT9U7C4_PAEHA|nr:ABC-type glycerol-3-phosphate transport system substrate-binding protein [Paenibacillus harenae]